MTINSLFKISILLILFAISNIVLAKDDHTGCSIVTGDIFPNVTSSSGNLKTPLGFLQQFSCEENDETDNKPDADGLYVIHGYLRLNKKFLFKADNIQYLAHNKNNSIIIFQAGHIWKADGGQVSSRSGGQGVIYRCGESLYLLDLQSSKPKLISFGATDSCNTLDFDDSFSSVKWENNGVSITMPTQVIFKYINRTMNLPPDSDDKHNKYIPLINPDSPKQDTYYNMKKNPHRKYQVFPPFSNEIKLDW